MRLIKLMGLVLVIVVGTLALPNQSSAQMNTVFDNVFHGILVDQLQLSPGEHKNHFLPTAEEASRTLSPALGRMIVQNLSSIPLSSTIAGSIYEMTPDGPQKTRTSWGPIFAERGNTLGKGSFNLGVTYSTLQFQEFRGVNTRDMTFAFTHQDMTIDDEPLGAEPTESDVIFVKMDMDIKSDVFAITGTYGLFSGLDLGFAVPIINLSLKGNAEATVSSFTFANSGTALHYFSGSPFSPDFTTTQSYSETVTGVGDVALRAKYSFKQTRKVQYGMLLDVRLPTGSEEDYLGSGETNLKLMGIFSKTFDQTTPHINLAYGYRGSEAESDEIAFALGFDQSMSSNLSFAFDILGLLPIDSAKTVEISPGTTRIVDHPDFPDDTVTATRDIQNSNIPEYEKDNIIDASFGVRWALFKNSIAQVNILVPMNDGGLRTGTSLNLGLTYYR